MPTATGKAVLVVSDATDAALRNALTRLRASGYSVALIKDVYTAMGKLARGEAVERVLVDTRNLSDSESSFIKLAPRYFPAVDAEALEFDTSSVSSPRTTIHASTVETLTGRSTSDPSQRASELRTPEKTANAPGELPTRPEAVSPSPVESSPPTVGKRAMPWTTLSTDGDVGSAAAEPSLHEAVRNRMAGNDPRTVRRRPPSPKPPANESKPPADSAIPMAREDLESTLNPDEPGDFDVDEEVDDPA